MPSCSSFLEQKFIYFYDSTFVVVFILLSLFSLKNNCQEKGQDKNCKYTDYLVRFRSIFHKNLFKFFGEATKKQNFVRSSQILFLILAVF